ncbi:P-loop containing nucleoside triphosphate hydrolase protein [Protomyces lactucae-debilis]|uniref:ATP-dependent RNA helicase n=1 Tax=Protomyces lactucae-debilis TaxID=2754530 RepID=A0A1Y2FUQ7_PROLT|nr:P-loop containing nucleoside triphosphate hydrolase protein [Protomyces lactucae-debilis]ORY87738.1 P-loop containing nucleoside triphosphate hydrolase protein [Protomyces lactucae-debilis]
MFFSRSAAVRAIPWQFAQSNRGICCFRAARNARLNPFDRGFSTTTRWLDEPTEAIKAAPTESSARSENPAGQVVDKPHAWEKYADRVHPKLRETLRSVFRYTHMSPVQQIIVGKMPFTQDLLVRSQTGTGKTLGFLIPAGQKLLERDDELAKTLSKRALKEYGNKNASCLIISPTRELASQLATEARRLFAHQDSNYKALLLIGGDKLKDTLKLMLRERNDFIVATPGRLMQLLREEPDFRDRIASIKTVIFDEADTLLDFGFRRDLEDIVTYLPKERQTFLFSATLSPEVKSIARSFMKNYEYIDTTPKDGAGALTQIKQQYMIVPLAEQLHVTLDLINETLANKASAKVIVFLPTTTLTVLYRQAFSVLRQLYKAEHVQNFAIHSLLQQEKRSKVSKAFRESASGTVLFSTDVSARGVDYPGVDLVIQLGAPRDTDIYTHKVGRTGRAGKSGRSVLMLDPIEQRFLKTLPSGLTITELSKDEITHAKDRESSTTQAVYAEAARFVSYGSVLSSAFGPYHNALSARRRDFGYNTSQVEAALEAWWYSLSVLPVPTVRAAPGRGQRGASGNGSAERRSESSSMSRDASGYSTGPRSRGPPTYSRGNFAYFRHETFGTPRPKQYGRKAMLNGSYAPKYPSGIREEVATGGIRGRRTTNRWT